MPYLEPMVVVRVRTIGEPDLTPRKGEVYCFSFRIRKVFFDRVLKGEKNYELRRASDFWNVRMMAAQKHLLLGGTVKAVIVCGNQTLYKAVKNIVFFCGEQLVDLDPSEFETVKPLDGGPWGVWRVNYVE
jgi:hypothetical protein